MNLTGQNAFLRFLQSILETLLKGPDKMKSAVTGEDSKLASPEEVNYLSLEVSQDQVTCILKQRFFAFGHFSL